MRFYTQAETAYPLMMTKDMKLGQKIALGTSKFRIITIVNHQLVCLEQLESSGPSPKVSIMQYEQVLQDARILEEI
jgi:hypothetical protein